MVFKHLTQKQEGNIRCNDLPIPYCSPLIASGQRTGSRKSVTHTGSPGKTMRQDPHLSVRTTAPGQTPLRSRNIKCPKRPRLPKNDLSPFSSLFVCGTQAAQVAARNINTDKFPNLNSMRDLQTMSRGMIEARLTSVDATAVPRDLSGLRTLFNSFHHCLTRFIIFGLLKPGRS